MLSLSSPRASIAMTPDNLPIGAYEVFISAGTPGNVHGGSFIMNVAVTTS